MCNGCGCCGPCNETPCCGPHSPPCGAPSPIPCSPAPGMCCPPLPEGGIPDPRVWNYYNTPPTYPCKSASKLNAPIPQYEPTNSVRPSVFEPWEAREGNGLCVPQQRRVWSLRSVWLFVLLPKLLAPGVTLLTRITRLACGVLRAKPTATTLRQNAVARFSHRLWS